MSHKLNVLIVEDSLIVAERIKEMLNELNEVSRIDEAIDSKEAMSMFDVEVPDVVLLDIDLPGKSGIEILREIKQKYFSTCVIMLTNHTERYIRELCQESGADYFFDKSTEFEKVSGALSLLSSEKGYGMRRRGH